MAEEEEAGTVGIINFRKQDSDQLPILTDHLHRLPCCIKFNGPTNVSQYFKPKSTEMEGQGLRVQESYFRGKKLLGATLPLPPSYSGFVLGKKNVQKRKATDLCEQNSSNCWEVNAKFENITYWNNEGLPSQDDTFFRSFHWLSVAEALHKPVTAEDLASASINLEKKLHKPVTSEDLASASINSEKKGTQLSESLYLFVFKFGACTSVGSRKKEANAVLALIPKKRGSINAIATRTIKLSD